MSSSGTSDFGEVVARLDYPMVIVTCGEGSGCLVGFSTQVSISPARYLVCVSKVNHTHAAAIAEDELTVHVLDADDRELASVYGELTGDDVDKRPLADLSTAAAWFTGRVVDRLDLGDHTGLVLEPVAGELRRWHGQLGYQSVKDLDPGHPA